MSTDDISVVRQVLGGILNNDNFIRGEAAKKLDELRKNVPALLYCLITIMHSNL